MMLLDLWKLCLMNMTEHFIASERKIVGIEPLGKEESQNRWGMKLTGTIRFGHTHNNDTNLFSFSIGRGKVLEDFLRKATSPGKMSLLDTRAPAKRQQLSQKFLRYYSGKGYLLNVTSLIVFDGCLLIESVHTAFICWVIFLHWGPGWRKSVQNSSNIGLIL